MCAAKAMEEDEVGRTTTPKFDESCVQDLMKSYYSLLFPWKEMYRWLSYGNDGKMPQADPNYFRKREFCFTLDGDIFVRYQSFGNGEELYKAIKEKVPAKIDLGPVYSVDPQKRSSYTSSGPQKAFTPIERELVFDIDMTDYDDVRACCDQASICAKCWPLMTAAIKILDTGLREDFGFRNLLWVFSGRRGIHCWVCDQRARSLSDEQRSAVANYFAVYKGVEAGRTKLDFTYPNMHPLVDRSYNQVLLPMWKEIVLPQQRVLETQKLQEKVLSMIPDEEICRKHREQWSQNRPCNGVSEPGALSVARWEKLAGDLAKANKRRTIADIIVGFTYPRLDIDVSKKMNHLLKAPFCVHPKTGKVCVPIDPKSPEAFDPDAVPTVAQLLNEINRREKSDQPASWHHTSMKEWMDIYFATFLEDLQEDVKADLQRKGRQTAEMPRADW